MAKANINELLSSLHLQWLLTQLNNPQGASGIIQYELRRVSLLSIILEVS